MNSLQTSVQKHRGGSRAQTDLPPAEQAVSRGGDGRFVLGNQAGLATRFSPGRSGNPAGRPKNVGQSQQELMNELAAQDLTTDELRAIANDPKQPHNLGVAAERLVAQRHAEEPLAREATKLVLDYTNGKPCQQLNVNSQSVSVTVSADLTQLSGPAKREIIALLSQSDNPPPLQDDVDAE